MRFRHARRSLHLAATLVLLASQLVFLAPSIAIAASGVVVNSTGDAADTLPGDGFCLTGGTNIELAPECTFRAALQEANASVSITEVTFDIPVSDPGQSGGTYIISPATVYPDIGSSVLVDATTQTGFSDTPIVVLDGSGATDIASGTDGLLIAGNSVTIRGLVVRDFPDDGIEIHGDDNHIYGNHVTGNDVGILVESGDNNTIGASSATDRNHIHSNDSHGVAIDGSLGSRVRGNVIGFDDSGSASANGGHGVYVWNSSNDTLVVDNVISANSSDGVALGSGVDTRAAVIANSIYANGGLGIDLGDDGQSGNDGGDLDSGPNGYLNYPVVDSAEAIGSVTQVDFTLDTLDGWYRVDFYLNPGGADPSGYGEGQTPAGSTVVHKTASTASFTHSITAGVGDVVTSTATGCAGASCGSPTVTSEYSAATTVEPANLPPQLGAIANVTVDEGDDVAFTVSATDPDPGDNLTFDLVGAPAGAAIDPDTGEFTWPTTEDDGPALFSFDIRVTDDGLPNLNATHTIEILVGEINEPPTITGRSDFNVNEQTLLTFNASASDPDLPANTLTFGLVGAPPGASITSTGTFVWTPTEAQGPKTYKFAVRVSDNGGLVDAEQVTVTVNETHRPPLVANPGSQTTPEGQPVNLHIVAIDPDLPANVLTYGAIGLPRGLTINPNTGDISGVVDYNAAAASPHTSTVTVTDNTGRTGTVTFTWTTPNTNRPPSLDIIPDRTADEETTLTFTVTATDPDVGTKLTYGLAGAPAGASINPATGVFTWTTDESHGTGSYSPTVTVIDDDTHAPLGDSQTFRITVHETNKPPVAVDDSATTAEDTPVKIDLLGNDSDEDEPADRLVISSVGRSGAGGRAEIEPEGTILYHPRADYHGLASFTYTLWDGQATTIGSVTVVVTPVNDRPVAMDDRYRLSSYQPVELPILLNDIDADGEKLTFALTSLPSVGSLRIEDDLVVYDPENGWTGSVRFGYEVYDAEGASSRATVEILVGAEVLVGAQELASELGVDVVPFEPPAPNFDAATLSLIDLDGITLLADSFFQTVGALRIPLGFLGVTVVMIVGFGATSEVPALVFGARRKHWSVVRLGRQQRLPAYSDPGGRKVVYNYDPTASGIVSTGKIRLVGTTEWVPVDTPNGPGWTYRKYLTEQVDIRAFINDPRPVKLIHELAERLRSGQVIDSLVSDRGLLVALTGSPNQIAPDELAALMGDKRLRNLPGTGSGLQTPEDFAAAVAQPFLKAYDSTPEVTGEVPHSKSSLIPTECWNYPYVAIGTGPVQPWLVFFEYKGGKPVITGLGIDE